MRPPLEADLCPALADLIREYASVPPLAVTEATTKSRPTAPPPSPAAAAGQAPPPVDAAPLLLRGGAAPTPPHAAAAPLLLRAADAPSLLHAAAQVQSLHLQSLHPVPALVLALQRGRFRLHPGGSPAGPAALLKARSRCRGCGDRAADLIVRGEGPCVFRRLTPCTVDLVVGSAREHAM